MFDANDYFPGFAAAQRAYENEEPEYYDDDDGEVDLDMMSEEDEGCEIEDMPEEDEEREIDIIIEEAE